MDERKTKAVMEAPPDGGREREREREENQPRLEWVDYIAVSYTHLDVYKRQLITAIGVAKKNIFYK